MQTKVGIKCSESKTLDNYHIDSKMRDGLRPECKKCRKSIRQQNYQKNKNRELEKNKLWKQSNPSSCSVKRSS